VSISDSRSKGSSHVSTQSSSPLGPSMKPSTDTTSAAMIFLTCGVVSRASSYGRPSPPNAQHRRSHRVPSAGTSCEPAAHLPGSLYLTRTNVLFIQGCQLPIHSQRPARVGGTASVMGIDMSACSSCWIVERLGPRSTAPEGVTVGRAAPLARCREVAVGGRMAPTGRAAQDGSAWPTSWRAHRGSGERR
jgi:hypothetical protein